MILALGLISIAAWLPTPCFCCDAQTTDWLTAFGVNERPVAKQHLFERSGWADPIVYGPDDVVPPMHVSVVELGPDTSGWISRRGRRGRWQMDAWQVTSVPSADLHTDVHVHWSYRIPLR